MNRGFACVGLYAPSYECNVGGVMRAAHCYGVGLVAVAGGRFKREPSDTPKAWRHIPTLVVEDLFDALPYSCVPVAVELTPDARSLVDYVHPERAFYIFGPETGSIPKKVLDRCRDKVMVPTVNCMNLAATVNVVLYDRLAKGILSYPFD